MPAVSRAQQRFMGMCAHDPQHAQGKCPTPAVAREFASTKHAGLPARKAPPKRAR
jgi:hypothetical protein